MEQYSQTRDKALLSLIRSGIQLEVEVAKKLIDQLTPKERWLYVDGAILDPVDLF